jgi:phage shock protein C
MIWKKSINYLRVCFCLNHLLRRKEGIYMERKIYLSDLDKKVGGVCGGLGEYFSVDSTIIRLLTVIITFLTSFIPGLIVYFIAWGIILHRKNY